MVCFATLPLICCSAQAAVIARHAALRAKVGASSEASLPLWDSTLTVLVGRTDVDSHACHRCNAGSRGASLD